MQSSHIILGIIVCCFILITTFRKTFRLPKLLSLATLVPGKMIIFVQIALVACILAFVYLLSRAQPAWKITRENYSDTSTTYSNAIDPTMGKTNNVAGFGYSATDPNNVANAAATYVQDFGSANASTQNFTVDNNLLQGSAVISQPNMTGSYPIYNEGGTGFVQTYDQLYKSSTTNMSQVGVVPIAPYISGGFCQRLANQPLELERRCNELKQDVCATTNCCVLLGGTKCVAGNEQGPINQANYSDFLLKNRDQYYYQGKCYGNCTHSFP